MGNDPRLPVATPVLTRIPIRRGQEGQRETRRCYLAGCEDGRRGHGLRNATSLETGKDMETDALVDVAALAGVAQWIERWPVN